MRIVAALIAAFTLTGCHSGALGAAGISGGVSILGIINQDWLAEQGAAVGLRINPLPVASPQSGSTPAAQ